MAREGTCEGISWQSWYRQTRIEILYNVVYLLCMFEAFTDMKMRIEPYVRLEIRVFFTYFMYFSMVSEIHMVANMYITA